LLRGSCAL